MMKTQTKVFLFVLALMTVVSLCFSVSAATPISITVEVDGDVLPGETITATVYLTGTGVKSMTIVPTYDSEIFEIQSAEWIESADFIMSEKWTETDPPVMAFSAGKDLSNEAMLVMTFKVKDNATVAATCDIGCEINIALVDDNNTETRYTTEENPDMVVVTPAEVEVACPHADTTSVAETAATCTAVGYTAGVYCNTCETYISGREEIPVIDHAYTVLQENETQHWYKCADCTATTTPADHAYTVLEKNETQHWYKCDVCTATDTFFDHSYTVLQKNETQHWYECDVCAATDTATDHTWDEGEITTQPTYTEEGVKTYTCTLEGCGQTKTEPVEVLTVLYGDVNGDGKVTNKDRTALARYLAKWTEYTNGTKTIDLVAADVNGDGKVTNKDRTKLARYLAKWVGYDTLP